MNKDSRGPQLELSSPGRHGSSSQEGTYYKVEFRTTSTMPTVLGDSNEPFPFVIDHYWRTLPIQAGAVQWGANIPCRAWDLEPAKHGLVSYLAAEAHRFAFLAYLEARSVSGSLCVETRLVAVKWRQTYSTEELGVTPHQGWIHKPTTIEPRHPKLPLQEAAE